MAVNGATIADATDLLSAAAQDLNAATIVRARAAVERISQLLVRDLAGLAVEEEEIQFLPSQLGDLPTRLPGPGCSLLNPSGDMFVLDQERLGMNHIRYSLSLPSLLAGKFKRLLSSEIRITGVPVIAGAPPIKWRDLLLQRHHCKICCDNANEPGDGQRKFVLLLTWRGQVRVPTLNDVKDVIRAISLRFRLHTSLPYLEAKENLHQVDGTFKLLATPANLARSELWRAGIVRTAAVTGSFITYAVKDLYELVLDTFPATMTFNDLERVWPGVINIVAMELKTMASRTDERPIHTFVANIVDENGLFQWRPILTMHGQNVFAEEVRNGKDDIRLGHSIELVRKFFDMDFGAVVTQVLQELRHLPGMVYRFQNGEVVRIQFQNSNVVRNLSELFYGLRCLCAHGMSERTLQGNGAVNQVRVFNGEDFRVSGLMPNQAIAELFAQQVANELNFLRRQMRSRGTRVDVSFSTYRNARAVYVAVRRLTIQGLAIVARDMFEDQLRMEDGAPVWGFTVPAADVVNDVEAEDDDDGFDLDLGQPGVEDSDDDDNDGSLDFNFDRLDRET